MINGRHTSKIYLEHAWNFFIWKFTETRLEVWIYNSNVVSVGRFSILFYRLVFQIKIQT